MLKYINTGDIADFLQINITRDLHSFSVVKWSLFVAQSLVKQM